MYVGAVITGLVLCVVGSDYRYVIVCSGAKITGFLLCGVAVFTGLLFCVLGSDY